MTQLLPLPEGDAERWIAQWPEYQRTFPQFPRSAWLGQFERYLANRFPFATKRERNLTARHYAPFELAQGHDVP